MIFERKENGHFSFNRLNAEILFNEILDDTIKTPEELEWCVEALIEALSTAVHDWFEDEGYEDYCDHCEIDLYFDTEVEKIKE